MMVVMMAMDSDVVKASASGSTALPMMVNGSMVSDTAMAFSSLEREQSIMASSPTTSGMETAFRCILMAIRSRAHGIMTG
jgi:hypothetical protein